MNNPIKLLLVDDEPDILEFLSYNFRKNGFDVISAKDGVDGLKKAVKEIPQLIISDILMPEMSGIAMCKEIKKRAGLDSTPIIFLTAVHADDKPLSAMLLEGEKFASKPIKFELLLKMVNKLLNEKAA